jgi:hypothetical protein
MQDYETLCVFGGTDEATGAGGIAGPDRTRARCATVRKSTDQVLSITACR